jgi:hypothetical protein
MLISAIAVLLTALWVARPRNRGHVGDRSATVEQQTTRALIHVIRARHCLAHGHRAAAFACCQAAEHIERRMK